MQAEGSGLASTSAGTGTGGTARKDSLQVPGLTVQSDDGSKPREPQIQGVASMDGVHALDSGSDSDDEDYSPFKLFTAESYLQLLEREAELRRKADEKKNRPNEGRLVDGELRFDDEDDDDSSKERDPALMEGNYLPQSMGEVPKDLISVPVEELDHNIHDKTFLVITKRFKKKYIHRFSATKSFFLLSPWNPLRRFAIFVATNQLFDYCIILTILVNCVFLALPTYSWSDNAEYVFLGIYTIEAIFKLTARGFFINKYTYLRDGWNWLDFIVIITAYVTIIMSQAGSQDSLGNVTALRTFRVFRALKTVSIVPGLKTIIAALLKSMRMLAEVLLLTLFCLMVFALFSLQVYLGVLRQKCVIDLPDGTVVTHASYLEHVKDPTNWYESDGEYLVCGNATGSGACPGNYTCLPDIGDNPNFGYTNFDNFGWAMLNTFQLITLDYWENPYNLIIRANGPWNIVFFIVVVFFGSFYLINLMLAVVSMSYEEEATTAGKEKEKEKKDKKLAEKKRQKKDQKADKSKTDTNHLQVMKAVNGSLASSSASLKSVGNGVVMSNSYNSIREDANLGVKTSGVGSIRDEAKTVDNVSAKMEPSQSPSKNPNPGAKDSSQANPGVLDPAGTDLPKSGSESGISGNVLVKLGAPGESTSDKEDSQPVYVNPLATMTSEDSQSIDSGDNDGDPPVVIVKASDQWFDSSDSEPDDDDDELVDRNCNSCGRFCGCYIPWLRFQNSLYRIVSDLIFDLFITLCIMLNVLTMSIDHYGMSEGLANGLKVANYVWTSIFTLEAILKILAMSKHYFQSGWNIFDFIIVIASLIDLGVEDVEGLSVFRAFRLLRLLRVFKLAQTWSTMRVLLSIILRTLGALGNLTFVLGIVIYIFAVIGMQLFGGKYTDDKFAPDEKPRWHFDEFLHALMLVFRILCGEWIEPLWDCMRASGELCMIVFLPTLVIGNMMVLNLFLALLLNSFATDSLKRNKESKDDSKMKQGWRRLKGLFSKRTQVEPESDDKPKKPTIANLLEELKRRKAAEELAEAEREAGIITEVDETTKEDGKAEDKDKDNVTSNGGVPSGEKSDTKADSGTDDSSKSPAKDAPKSPSKLASILKKTDNKKESSPEAEGITRADSLDASNSVSSAPEGKRPSIFVMMNANGGDDDDDEESSGPPGDVADWWPGLCHAKCSCWTRMNDSPTGQRWRNFRRKMAKITEHKAFEYFILVIIMASSISLCFEDIYIDEKPTLKAALYYLNIIFATVFAIEMLMKWVALGWHKYFTSFWTILDFSIVVISFVSLAAESLGADQITSFRALRTLRALRPLRAISRWQGMKIVVNALMYAIPAIFNVLLVCLVFWLIFSIAGVQLFGGRFHKCVDAAGERLPVSVINNKAECLNATAAALGYRWKNSDIHFDTVIHGYLALFQVATWEGWIEVMRDAVDSRGLDNQPDREANFHAYWFFVVFIIVGSFFTLNLFIGVIIDNFNMLKKKYEGGYLDMFLTQSQKNYYYTMKKLGNKKPQKTIKRPKSKVQGFFFDVSVSTKFELAIVILILLNMISMAIEHYRQAESYADALDVMNVMFTAIFTLEALVKIIGMRWHYFRRAWNVFDFIIVVISIIGVVLDDVLSNVFVTPTLLRVVRVFRIGRVLRLIRAAKGIRKLLFALVISLPALFNIGMLLFLIVFIYAIFGMALFGQLKHSGIIDEIVNFETFGSSMLLLFRLTTSAGWNDVLYPMLISSPDCDDKYWTKPDGTKEEVPNGECGTPGLAVFYMVTFIMVTYLIVINMYIAVILENFSQAHQQEEVGITEDDFEMFYVVWERYDPHATQFIKYEQLSDFVADLEQPLGMSKPNEIALVAFDLSIYEGDRLHCLDILVSLVKHVLGAVEDTQEFRDLKQQMEDKFQDAFPTRVQQRVQSTTMKRKKEDVAAKTLQRAWRKHKAAKNIRKITELAMEAQFNRSRTSFSIGRRPSITPSTRQSPSPRPGSSNSMKTFRTGTKAEEKRKTSMGKSLKVPTANEIKLPSDNEVSV